LAVDVGRAWKQIRRAVVLAAGLGLLLVGIAMIVLPGPATVVIPAALALLATEFAWARRWLRQARDWAKQAAARVSARRRSDRG